MPGVNLNLDLPNVTDTMATMVAKTKAALSAIQDDLAPKVVASELNINSSLSFNGNTLTGLGSATLVSGNVPTAAGSLYYTGGEFYAIDGTGTVKLTNVGQIAVAGVKGIGGDYGNVGNNANVYYDNASGEYRFFDGTGTGYGTLLAKKLVLKNATGFAPTFQASASQAANYNVITPVALPAAAQVVTIDNAGQLKDDGVIASNMQLTGTAYIKRGNRTRTLPFMATGMWNFSPGSLPGYTSAASKGCVSLVTGTYFYPIMLEDCLERIQTITVYMSTTTSATAVSIAQSGNTGLTSFLGAIAGGGGTGSCAAGGISRAIVLTPTAPAVAATGNIYWLEFVVPASSGAELYSMDITTDVP